MRANCTRQAHVRLVALLVVASLVLAGVPANTT
jgi:hypothetical protein